MVKYIIISIMCSFVNISYAAQQVCDSEMQCEVITNDKLGQYVDVKLMIPGQEDNIKSILLSHPGEAKRLKDLHAYFNRKVEEKYRNMSFNPKTAARYITKYKFGTPPFNKSEAAEYDNLICQLGLDKFMNAQKRSAPYNINRPLGEPLKIKVVTKRKNDGL